MVFHHEGLKGISLRTQRECDVVFLATDETRIKHRFGNYADGMLMQVGCASEQ